MTRSLLLIGTLLTLITTTRAQPLVEGTWTGYMITPGRFVTEFTWDVQDRGNTITLTWLRGTSAVYDLRIEEDLFWFTWEPDFPVQCLVKRQADTTYLGSCKDPWGGKGPITVAPPGTRPVDSDSIDVGSSFQVWEEAEALEQAQLEALERKPPAGTMTDVGGHKLNWYAMGEGGITVVIASGLGEDRNSWLPVQSLVSQFARIVAYDRAGVGLSETGSGQPTPMEAAKELHRMLDKGGFKPPYVLVGQEQGGFYTRAFASQYPDEVAGMVFVDASHEKQGQRWKALNASQWDGYLKKQDTFMALLPKPTRAEYEVYKNILTTGEIEGMNPLPDVPIVVLTSMRPMDSPRWIGETPAGLKAKQALQKTWADQVTKGRQDITTQSSSAIHREEPQLVIEAIRDVVEQAQLN